MNHLSALTLAACFGFAMLPAAHAQNPVAGQSHAQSHKHVPVYSGRSAAQSASPEQFQASAPAGKESSYAFSYGRDR